MIYRVYDLQGTNHHRNSMQKIFFEILMFRYPGGAAKIFRGHKANFCRNSKTTADRKSSLQSNDTEHLISYLFSIHFYCLSATEKML